MLVEIINGIANEIDARGFGNIGLSDQDKTDIENFLKDSVDKWCSQHPNEWFTAKDLVHTTGWDNTPLVKLNALDTQTGKNEASGNAGKLLWNVLLKHSQKFEERQGAKPKEYRLVP